MATRSRGNGTNFDWLRESCDTRTCDLSPDGNPEKYGRPMKSAIDFRPSLSYYLSLRHLFCLFQSGRLRLNKINVIFMTKTGISFLLFIILKHYSLICTMKS